MNVQINIISIISFVCFLGIICCDQSIYESLYSKPSYLTCTSFYTKDGFYGCRTKVDGIRGKSKTLNSRADIKAVDLDEVNIVVVPYELFDYDSYISLIHNDRVGGIILQPIHNFSSCPVSFEPQTILPYLRNMVSNPDYPFQLNGQNISAQSIMKPIHLLHSQIKDFNQHHYFFSNIYQGPDDVTSTKCLSKGACTPIGGQSVYSFIGSYDNPYYILSVNMDTSGYLYGRNNGNVEISTSMSVQLSIIESLKKVFTNLKYSLLVVFLQGESGGFVGSRKFFHDIMNFECHSTDTHSRSEPFCTKPLKLSLNFQRINITNLQGIIHMESLLYGDSCGLFVHGDDASTTFINQIVTTFKDVPSSCSIKRSTTYQLPPNYISYYRKSSSILPNIPMITISSYDEHYHNVTKTLCDTPIHYQPSQSLLYNVTMFLSSGLYLLLNDTTKVIPSEIHVDPSYIQSTYYCIAFNNSCGFMRLTSNHSFATDNKLLPVPNYYSLPSYSYPLYSIGEKPYFYKSTFWSESYEVELDSYDNSWGLYYSNRFIESYIRDSLYYSLNSSVESTSCNDNSQCGDKYTCIHQQCILCDGCVYYHDAVSPNLYANDYGKYQIIDINDPDPIITEPFWSGEYGPAFNLYLYNNLSMTIEGVMFGIGLIISIISALATIKLKKGNFLGMRYNPITDF